MTKLFYITQLLSVSGALFYSNDDFDLFKDFQFKFNKDYLSLEEQQKRYNIFRLNLHKIIDHNLDITQNFTLDINQFSDLTSDEFKNYVGKLNFNRYGCLLFNTSFDNTPISLDWRNSNVVTSVKDQGQCGSCWAFSATGAIESAWAISTGELNNLSEQELVDCAIGIKYGGHGCNGGQMDGAFKYAKQYGLCLELEYPYTATQSNCVKCEGVEYISNCYNVNPNNQISLKYAVSQTPVSVAIEADTFYFQSYSGGVLDSPLCGTTLDHGVLVVGYGSENGLDYWLVKNSWGLTWGLDGYVKILKTNSSNDPGICGIAMQPSFPVV
jgi:C1A family cysteine protease